MGVHEPVTKRHRRKGRGQLSSLDRLPSSADGAIAWANTQLHAYNLTQGEILRELNSRLADLGIPPVSRSAFSRYSVRLAIGARTETAAQAVAIDLFDHMRISARSDGRQLEVDALRFVLVQLLTRDEVDYRKVEAASQLLISIMTEGGFNG
jgi:hypothetical protein